MSNTAKRGGRVTAKGTRPSNFKDRSPLGGLLENLRDGLASKRERLADEKFTVEKGGGLVTIGFNALGEAEKVTISREVTDIEDIEDLLLACLRDGFSEATRRRQASIESLGEGVDLSAFGVDLSL